MGGRRNSSFLLRSFALLMALSLTLAAPAQGLFGLFQSQGGCNTSFCSGGTPVLVERYDPSCPGHFPAVIILHGADGVTQYAKVYRAAAQQLAQSGYVAFIVHYFNSTGTAAMEANSMTKMDPQQFRVWMRTVSDAITYVSCQPNVDARRIGLFGFSLGSYLALSVGAADPRVDAIVEFAGGLPAQFNGRAKSLPPTMIIHGDADTMVPVTQAYALDQLLTKNKVEHQTVIYPCQGHSMDQSSQMDAAERIRAFLAANL